MPQLVRLSSPYTLLFSQELAAAWATLRMSAKGCKAAQAHVTVSCFPQPACVHSLVCLCCSALFSKTWQLREAALKHICRGFQNGTVPHDSGSDAARELVRNAGPPLQRLLRDKVGSVLVLAQQVNESESQRSLETYS